MVAATIGFVLPCAIILMLEAPIYIALAIYTVLYFIVAFVIGEPIVVAIDLDDNHCSSCGYDLRGADPNCSRQCPECGQSIDPENKNV